MAAILSHFASLERLSYFRGVQGRDLGEPSRRLVGEDKGGSLASEAFGTFAGQCAALEPLTDLGRPGRLAGRFTTLYALGFGRSAPPLCYSCS